MTFDGGNYQKVWPYKRSRPSSCMRSFLNNVIAGEGGVFSVKMYALKAPLKKLTNGRNQK